MLCSTQGAKLRNWQHLSDVELEIYIEFYNEHLSSLVRKGLRKSSQTNYKKIELMQNRVAELEKESEIRLMY